MCPNSWTDFKIKLERGVLRPISTDFQKFVLLTQNLVIEIKCCLFQGPKQNQSVTITPKNVCL